MRAATAIGLILLFASIVSTWQAFEAHRQRNVAQEERRKARLAQQDAVQKQHELRETLTQLHSLAVDKVYLEMAGGDESKVKAAIDQAELAGVPGRLGGTLTRPRAPDARAGRRHAGDGAGDRRGGSLSARRFAPRQRFPE